MTVVFVVTQRGSIVDTLPTAQEEIYSFCCAASNSAKVFQFVWLTVW